MRSMLGHHPTGRIIRPARAVVYGITRQFQPDASPGRPREGGLRARALSTEAIEAVRRRCRRRPGWPCIGALPASAAPPLGPPAPVERIHTASSYSITLRGKHGSLETAAAGGADRRSAKNAAAPHGPIARSAPPGAAAPLPLRGPRAKVGPLAPATLVVADYQPSRRCALADQAVGREFWLGHRLRARPRRFSLMILLSGVP
jgi:hypothetical protein